MNGYLTFDHEILIRLNQVEPLTLRLVYLHWFIDCDKN